MTVTRGPHATQLASAANLTTRLTKSNNFSTLRSDFFNLGKEISTFPVKVQLETFLVFRRKPSFLSLTRRYSPQPIASSTNFISILNHANQTMTSFYDKLCSKFEENQEEEEKEG